jgi:hypothetical protein
MVGAVLGICGGRGCRGRDGGRRGRLCGTAQSLALAAGDEAGWLQDVEPTRPQVVAAYRRMYRNLHAMGVSGWRQVPNGYDTRLTGAQKVEVVAAYCLATPSCPPPDLVKATTMQVRLEVTFSSSTGSSSTGRMFIIDLDPPDTNNLRFMPPPWRISDLTAVVGTRVVIAAGADLAGRLPAVLPLAEAAAAVADRYARWTPPPGRYLIYLPGPAERRTWFGGVYDPTELGVALPADRYDIPTMVYLPEAADPRQGRDALRIVIQHELGHVVTRLGADYGTRDSLSEGIADYVAFAGAPVSAYKRLPALAWYLRSARWNGHVQLSDQVYDDDLRVVNAAYAIGYLTLRHLADRYGETAMLAFYAAVERDLRNPATAAPTTLGQPWPAVEQDCATYIRSLKP